MVNKRRLAVTLGLVGFVTFWSALYRTDPVSGQAGRGAIKGGLIQPKPVPPKAADGTAPASQYSGIKLSENANFRGYLEVARECIKDKSWQDAVTAVQLILDNKEDFYAKVTEVGQGGQKSQRWTSVKFEANNLLGTMPEEGLDVYEQRFGAAARNKLVEAKNTGSRELLAEVAQRYLHTKAGIEANDLLATYFMDRGQFFMAALRFEKLFGMNPERVKLSDLTLFKAALAYRRAGDAKNADATWHKLEPRLRDQGGLHMGGDLVAIAQLRQVMEESSKAEAANPFDWPYVRGNVSNSAQAQGSPPLLDEVLFPPRPTIKDDRFDFPDSGGDVAKARIDAAIDEQNKNNNPVLPGFFPIASNNLLIYRSYHDVRAIFLQDEKDNQGEVINKAGTIAWKSTDFDGALANVLADNRRITLDNWLARYLRPNGFGSLVYENTLNGTLSTDHRYVYAIDDLAVPAPADQFTPYVWNSTQVGQEVKPLVLQNTLCAFDLRQGNNRWRLGPGKKDDFAKDDRGKDDPYAKEFADSHFLGAPVMVGGKLYVLNEKNLGPSGDSDLRLVCIDPYKLAGPGRPTVIEPIQSLGSVLMQNRVTHDLSRRLNAVHLGYGEGILVCPTNAGEVLGVDIMSRSLAWAYPYREQMPAPAPFLTLQQQQMLRTQLMTAAPNPATWHSAPPVIQDGKVVFTAPDAHSVHCINLRDGTPVWKKKHSENDLYLAGVFDGKVLIVGKTAVRALSLADGRQLWQLPTGDLPSGQGVASNNIYYLPLKKGEIMALDIGKGQVKAHNRAKTAGVSPGNLIFYEGAVISQTPTQVVVYPQLAARLRGAQAALRADPDNPAKLIDRGELLLADGQVQAAIDDLEKALAKKPAEPLSDRARRKLYEGLTDLLAADFANAGRRYLDEYRRLCEAPENPSERQLRQAQFYRIVGQGREAEGNLVEAFAMYRKFGALPIHREQGGIAAGDDPANKVPANVWLRGRVGGMIAKATPEQRAPLEKKIAQEWQAVEAKKDLDAIRGFVGMFDTSVAVGREARWQLAEIITENNDRPHFLEAELSLYQLRGADYRADPQSGGRALASLARLEEKKGSAQSMKLAAAYYRELNREFAAVPVRIDSSGSHTGAELLNDLAADPRFRPYLDEPASPWSRAKIAARELPSGTYRGGLQGFVFQPEGDLTPIMKQYRLVRDTANIKELRLVDLATNAVRWRLPLETVALNSMYPYPQNQIVNANNPNAKFRFFQAKGNLAVLQLGALVYGIDADVGKILWQHNLLDAGSLNHVSGMINQQVSPDYDGYLELVATNQLNGQRTRVSLGHVAAVEASYVALMTRKGLVVLDPIHGTPLWTKPDVHAATRAFGDETYIYLVETSEGSAGSGRILRASDGVEVPAADFGGIYQNRVKVLGRRILAATAGRDNLTLKLHDIVLSKDVWSKSFDAKAVILQTVDPGLAGVIEPNGKVVILDAHTGGELLRASVNQGRVGADDVKGLKDPLLLQDADRFYVALNKPIDAAKVAGGILANNFSNGLRCATINGWLVALQRRAGQQQAGTKMVAWKAGDVAWHSSTPLLNQLIVLEQFDRLPVLLLSARYSQIINGGAGGSRWAAVTQSIDKETGKLIFDSSGKTAPAFAASAPQFAAFNLDLANGTINMIGLPGTSTIQHYIDDGRKPAAVPGMIGSGVQAGVSSNGMANPYGGIGGIGGNGIGLALPANGQIIIRPVPIRIAPVLPVPKE